MKVALALLCVGLAVSPLLAQNPPSTATPVVLQSDLDRLQAAAAQASQDLGRMRIDKWKADGESKRQAQANADSVQRNLTTALPELIQAVRTSPQDLTAQFKLYRNLNALYDVMVSVTESAGAFGQKNDFQALQSQLEIMDSVRHDLGDSVERLTQSNSAELNQLRAQIRIQQAAAAAAAAPPRKVVVDDNQPSKKPAHKKKTAARKPSDSEGSDSGSSTGTPNAAPVASPSR